MNFWKKGTITLIQSEIVGIGDKSIEVHAWIKIIYNRATQWVVFVKSNRNYGKK